MNVMTCPNEGLSYLLSKYQVAAEGEARLVKGKNALLIGEKEYALLPWRYERRMVELKNLLNDGTLKDPCVLRTTLITHKDECLRCMIKREFDIAEFLFDSKIVAVYAVSGVSNNHVAVAVAVEQLAHRAVVKVAVQFKPHLLGTAGNGVVVAHEYGRKFVNPPHACSVDCHPRFVQLMLHRFKQQRVAHALFNE